MAESSTTTTRVKLLDAAERLFAQTGIGGTSLRAITSEANTNLASIHYHFGGKEALLQRSGEDEKIIVAPETGMSGIPAGVRELIEAMDEGRETKSPMAAAMNVMEVIFGFLESQRRGNVRVDLPLTR